MANFDRCFSFLTTLNFHRAGGIIFCNTAGLTTADLETFEYVRRVPLYPFETDLQYETELQVEEALEEAVARL